MLIAKVVGSAVATLKDPRTAGLKLLVVRPVDGTGAAGGDPFVSADTIGAGEGDLVLIATGSAARVPEQTREAPIDAAVIGILDSYAAG